MRLSDLETDVETGYGGKEIKTLSALGPRDYILSLVSRKIAWNRGCGKDSR